MNIRSVHNQVDNQIAFCYHLKLWLKVKEERQKARNFKKFQKRYGTHFDYQITIIAEYFPGV